MAHPAVYDCVVAGRPSERWGNEVVAVVRIRDGYEATDEQLLAEASNHIARYKLPKEIVRVDEIVRSPSGKADYRWARSIAGALTMAPHLDAATVEPLVGWAGVMQAIVDGHDLPEAQLDDTLLRRGDDALLSRSALIDGLGSLVKTATVFPGNASLGRPTVNGSVALFSDDDR